MKLTTGPTTYPPREDSSFLLDYLASNLTFIDEYVFEIGVGNGYILLSLCEKFGQSHFLGGDISFDAALNAHKNAIRNGVNVLLVAGKNFEYLRSNFSPSIFIFNPPYLPSDSEIDKFLSKAELNALVGGSQGIEALEKVVQLLPAHSTGFFVLSSTSVLPEKFILSVAPKEGVVLKSLKFAFETLFLIKVSS